MVFVTEMNTVARQIEHRSLYCSNVKETLKLSFF